MLTVTKKAAAVLKAEIAAEGAADDAGIRILRGVMPNESGIAVAFAISDDPDPDDEEFEQEGLRIFVEDALVEPLDGRTLDVREADEGCGHVSGPIAKRPGSLNNRRPNAPQGARAAAGFTWALKNYCLAAGRSDFRSGNTELKTTEPRDCMGRTNY